MPRPQGAAIIANRLQEFYANLTYFFAENGWYLVFTLAIVYYVKTQFFGPWWRAEREKRVLREAQRQERVEVLDRDRQRVREKQMKEAVALAAAGGGGAAGKKKSK